MYMYIYLVQVDLFLGSETEKIRMRTTPYPWESFSVEVMNEQPVFIHLLKGMKSSAEMEIVFTELLLF